MAPCSTYLAGGEVGIYVSVPVEVTTVMGLAILIIAVGPVVSLILLVVLIHYGNVFLVCLYSDLPDSERCVPFDDRAIDWCKRCTVWFLWFGGWCDLLYLGVLRIAGELFPVIISLVSARVMMGGGGAAASPQIVYAICVREDAGGGLVF